MGRVKNALLNFLDTLNYFIDGSLQSNAQTVLAKTIEIHWEPHVRVVFISCLAVLMHFLIDRG